MPIYDLVVIIQKLEREALKSALKRSANYIFDENGIIRKIENLGFQQLPYSIFAKGKTHKSANVFIFNYDAGVKKPKQVLEKLKLDLDIVRATNFMCAKNVIDLHTKRPEPECTLHLDLLPPPFRPTVMKLQEIGRKKKRRVYTKNADDSDFMLF